MCYLAAVTFSVCGHRTTSLQPCHLSRKLQAQEGYSPEDCACRIVGFGSTPSQKSKGQLIFGWRPECTSTLTAGKIIDERVIQRYWAIKAVNYIDRPLNAMMLIQPYIFSDLYDDILDHYKPCADEHRAISERSEGEHPRVGEIAF